MKLCEHKGCREEGINMLEVGRFKYYFCELHIHSAIRRAKKSNGQMFV